MSTPVQNSKDQCQLENWTRTGNIAPDQLGAACDELRQLGESASQAEQFDLYELVQTLLSLIDLAEMLRLDEASEQADEIMSFVGQQLSIAVAFVNGNELDEDAIQQSLDQASANWGEHLELLGSNQFTPLAPARPAEFESTPSTDSMDLPSSQQIEAMMAVLGNADEQTTTQPADPQPEPKTDPQQKSGFKDTAAGSSNEIPVAPEHPSLSDDIRNDAELREAYLDDANRCLVAMEQVALQAEEQANNQSLLCCYLVSFS